jgi:AraC-like DNA-binding protein
LAGALAPAFFLYNSRVDRLWAARRVIDERYAEPLVVEDVARAAGLSLYHFIREFRRAFGCTPGRYLRERRLTRARQLLAVSDLPVTDICFAVGFESLGSFCTLFRRSEGTTPVAYRSAERARRAKQPRPPFVPGCFLHMQGVPAPRPRIAAA